MLEYSTHSQSVRFPTFFPRGLAMSQFGFQTWNSAKFSIERKPGREPGTVILSFSGPFTMRDVYSSLPTMELTKILALDPAPGECCTTKNIIDLSNCPYMDSTGLGMIVTHHVRCQNKGIKLVAAAMSPRVRQVFKMTRVDTVVPIATTVEEAEVN